MRVSKLVTQVSIFVLAIGLAAVLPIQTMHAAQADDSDLSFQFKGGEYQLRVINSESGSDVFLTGPGHKNLSAGFPGENIFPHATVNEEANRFLVSWIHYMHGDVQMCLYDSLTNNTYLIPLQGFKSACPLEVVFYRNAPYLLLFQGNNSNNADLFSYHLQTGEIRNLTNSLYSEQDIVITDKRTRVLIETKTVKNSNRYDLKKRNLKIRLTESEEIVRIARDRPASMSVEALNTIVGFGDSITWGTMRMDPENHETDYYHPELTYLAQLKGMLDEDYGEVFTVNLGKHSDKTSHGLERMPSAFEGVQAYFCLVMFGTNDVVFRTFDVDTSIQNLEEILTQLKTTYGMYPIISTIPPQKRETAQPRIQYFKERTEELNAAIIELATHLGVPVIDTYGTFFSGIHDWHDLLETYKGNHPSPLGHSLIAGLFKEKILEVPPAAPGLTKEDTTGNRSSRTIFWDGNHEFDFSHYNVEFGYAENNLNRKYTSETSYYQFLFFPLNEPFYPKIYYRIQSVDKDGNASDFTPVQHVEY